MDIIKYLICFLLIASLLFALVIVAMVGTESYLVEKPMCYARTVNIGYPVRWSFWGGCQIEVSEGQWIPLENYRYFEP